MVLPTRDQIYPLYQQSVPGKIDRNSSLTNPPKLERKSAYWSGGKGGFVLNTNGRDAEAKHDVVLVRVIGAAITIFLPTHQTWWFLAAH